MKADRFIKVINIVINSTLNIAETILVRCPTPKCANYHSPKHSEPDAVEAKYAGHYWAMRRTQSSAISSESVCPEHSITSSRTARAISLTLPGPKSFTNCFSLSSP